MLGNENWGSDPAPTRWSTTYLSALEPLIPAQPASYTSWPMRSPWNITWIASRFFFMPSLLTNNQLTILPHLSLVNSTRETITIWRALPPPPTVKHGRVNNNTNSGNQNGTESTGRMEHLRAMQMLASPSFTSSQTRGPLHMSKNWTHDTNS